MRNLPEQMKRHIGQRMEIKVGSRWLPGKVIRSDCKPSFVTDKGKPVNVIFFRLDMNGWIFNSLKAKHRTTREQLRELDLEIYGERQQEPNRPFSQHDRLIYQWLEGEEHRIMPRSTWETKLLQKTDGYPILLPLS
jgi:hypothetical protein